MTWVKTIWYDKKHEMTYIKFVLDKYSFIDITLEHDHQKNSMRFECKLLKLPEDNTLSDEEKLSHFHLTNELKTSISKVWSNVTCAFTGFYSFGFEHEECSVKLLTSDVKHALDSLGVINKYYACSEINDVLNSYRDEQLELQSVATMFSQASRDRECDFRKFPEEVMFHFASSSTSFFCLEARE